MVADEPIGRRRIAPFGPADQFFCIGIPRVRQNQSSLLTGYAAVVRKFPKNRNPLKKGNPTGVTTAKDANYN
jgi:hypothetical protein